MLWGKSNFPAFDGLTMGIRHLERLHLRGGKADIKQHVAQLSTQAQVMLNVLSNQGKFSSKLNAAQKNWISHFSQLNEKERHEVLKTLREISEMH
jgi:hypothetical protein